VSKRWHDAYEAARGNPTGVYRFPAHVLRDRRFDAAQRLAILKAWEADSGADPRDLPQIRELIAGLERSSASAG
jgi:hypothetical protein